MLVASRTLRSLALVALGSLLAGCPDRNPFDDVATPDATAADAPGDATRACPPDAAPSVECPLCQPGVPYCTPDGLGTRVCNADGLGFTDATRCGAGELCGAGRCEDPCAGPAMANSYQGCEFFAVGTLNSPLGHHFATTTRDEFPLAVALTNPWGAPAHVTLSGGGLAAPLERTVAPHGAEVVTLPWVLALAEGGDPAAPRSARAPDGAVRIRSDRAVAAYQFNPVGSTTARDPNCDQSMACFAYTNDASLLLPVAALRRQYIVASRATVRARAAGDTEWRVSAGFIAVVGTSEAPTDVTVRVRGRTTAGAGIAAAQPGDVITQRLARGDVLQVLSDTSRACLEPEPDTVRRDVYCRPVPEEDLTGSIVEASAPVAVFAGHDCALVPYDRTACDHLEEQVFPVESLGRRYLVARRPPADAEPNLVRVVATRANTTVTVSPASAHPAFTLAAPGEYAEFEQRESLELTASEPVLVAQFLVGANYDRARVREVAGDPDMQLVVPVDQYRNAYSFVASPGFSDTQALLVLPRGERVVLDGALVTPTPAARVADFDIVYLPLSRGAHQLAAFRPGIRFGLTVSGLASYVSYTYPAGLDLAPISPPL